MVTETLYRFVYSIILFILLFFDNSYGIAILVWWTLLEGFTNIRITNFYERFMTKEKFDPKLDEVYKINFDSQRALRITVALLIYSTYFLFDNTLWFFPWFIASMWYVSGIVKMCPMAFTLKYIGFR